MPRFRNLSIKQKLITLITVTAGIALLLACSSFMNYELQTYQDGAAARIQAMAQMIEGTSTAALAFGDARAASETLSTLKRQPHILEAAIYGRDGVALAKYTSGTGSEVPAKPAADGVRFGNRDLSIFHPVILGNERVGTVYLRSDLAETQTRLGQYGGIAVLVFLASMVAAFAISAYVQRFISGPVLQLAEAAGRISRNGDYSIRAERTSTDETGLLVDRFNEMLEQIRVRDEALRRAQEELEQRVADRTSRLQSEITERKTIEKHLIQARNAAEASNRAKSEFLANMSHELRTPLNAIIGYSEMLEEEADAEIVPDLRRIHSSGKHLLSLINDVLDLSKIEAGRFEIYPEDVDARSLTEDVIATAEPLARENQNRLVVECDVSHTVVSADPLKLRQILLNLVSNACKFTVNGVVTLGLRRYEIDGSHWFEWAVSDTGIGISADQMPKLFKAFSQVDSSFTRAHGGTGLGLAISQRLCHLMGGELTASSEVGRGSTFTLRLPVTVDASLPPAPAAEVMVSEIPVGPRSSDTVLVIDDDPAVRDLLSRSLQKRGFRVVASSHGEEGLELAIRHLPAAVVLDVILPDVDGWSVLRRLRGDVRLLHTPVFVHTITDSRPGDLSFEHVEFLQKPASVDQLAGMLRRLLPGGVHAGQEAPKSPGSAAALLPLLTAVNAPNALPAERTFR